MDCSEVYQLIEIFYAFPVPEHTSNSSFLSDVYVV
jgi:hypothetical protein